MNLINERLIEEDEEKYVQRVINPTKYASVTQNNSLFRNNGYKIERRFSSDECLRSRYLTKCSRRKMRMRSKSDPNLLPFTKRFHRKLEVEYRPNTMNIFNMNRMEKTNEKI